MGGSYANPSKLGLRMTLGDKIMILEYPEYFERFRCIGGACPDTCCAGWEVDIDDESAEYYKNVKGPFGDILRSHIREDEGERYFPLTEKHRCPFLNNKNLCDIYTNIGEESLCQTCTEYPRYFMDVGNYEQMDMSLSCMELGRIFYKETGKIDYVRSENAVEGDLISEEEQETLIEVLALRNRCIALLQDDDDSFPEKMTSLRALISEAEGAEPEEKDCSRAFLDESFSDLVSLLESMDSISDEWTSKLKSYRQIADSEDAMKKEDLFRSSYRPELDSWLSKTAVYFVFRYLIDTLIDGDIEFELCLIHRSLRLIYFMLFTEWLSKGSVNTEDMIYVAHLYSKQVEHDDSNVEKVKNLC